MRALEIDSYEHHSSPADMEHDAARRNLFLAAGWRSYSLTPRQVRDDPAASVHFLRTILPQRHLSGASASAWLG